MIESTGPIAVETSAGHRVPVDLSLNDVGKAFEPTTSAVGVRIPKQLGEGVQLSGSGVSLMPVTEQGSALGGSEGALNGAAVFYANTQTNTDTLAKPMTGGFEIDSLLRSVDSPKVLYFKVGMPVGASLVNDEGPGGARVVLNGQTIAGIAPPSAQDAAGTNVPVQMTVSGSTLVVTVKHGASEYQYPIEVDPRAYDYTMALPSNCENYGGEKTDWEFAYGGGSFKCYTSGYGDIMATVGGVNSGEYDEFRYPAHGQAGVAYINGEMQASVSTPSKAWTKAEFVHGTVEVSHTWANAGESFGRQLIGSCDKPVIEEGVEHCLPYNYENELRIVQTDTATENVPEGYGFWFEFYNGTWVSIFQEKGPEVSFNTSEATLSEASGRQNVLYGSGGWLGERNGAVEVTAKDPGLGVSDVKIKDLTAGVHGEHWTFNDPIYEDHQCYGVWCNVGQTFKTNFTYSPEMAEGTNTFEVCAEDEAAMKTCTEATVDVDNTPPHEIKLTGMPEDGAEISATPHQITVEATDGTKPTPSSGIKSIKVSVDGKEIAGPSAECSPGECTANGTWTIDGESLGAGEHKLEIVATDNANNVSPSSTKVVTFAIRNATPVKLGPGTVDPVTGEFALTTTDVDMAGAGGVTRSYDSRSPATNLESPLGPDWNLTAGTGQSLKLLPDGSAELQGAGGEPTIFALNKAGKFEAPKGDENLTLEAKEKEAGKGITEYLLKDPAAGTTTVFTRPLGVEDTPPSYGDEFSQAGVILGHPGGIAIDSSGDEWVTDSENGRILEFSPEGSLLHYYSSYGWEAGKVKSPSGIAINQSNGNVYVADEGNNRIDEFSSSGAFVREFSWKGVSNYDYPREPKGVAVDSSGNVWVADYGDNRIDEFTGEGKLIATFGYGVSNKEEKFEECTSGCWSGIAGSSNGEFSKPDGLTYSNGGLWVSEAGNNRVQELTTAGVYVKKFGTSGSGNGEFSKPEEIAAEAGTGNLYVADSGNNRVEDFTSSGAFVGKFGSLGSGGGQFDQPSGVAVARGGVYVTDRENDRIELWVHSTWLATRTESTAPGDTRATSYRSVVVEGRAITEPIEELGSVPAGVSCGKNPAEVAQVELSARLAELKAGCRALSFTYAEKTTATGEASSQWGEYDGQLAGVLLTAYNPSTKAMQTTAVAQYSYDNKGRLRAEWDPRISPSLKAIYGYDAEGHVTTLSPPGRQPWLMHYAAIAGDANSGRILSVTRAGASTAFGDGSSPSNTAVPTLSSTSPVIGTTLSVSGNGSWNNSPLAYTDQWEDCNSSGLECTPIAGAVNQSYTPQASDAGYTLIAQVTAQNATGNATAATAASKALAMPTPTISNTFGKAGSGAGELSNPVGIGIDASGNLWVAEAGNKRFSRFSSSGTFLATYGWGVSNGKEEFETCTSSCRGGLSGTGNGEFASPYGLAVNKSTGNVYVSDFANDRVQEFSSSGTFIAAFGSAGTGDGQFKSPGGITIDSNGDVWVADFGNGRLQEFTSSGVFMRVVGSPGSGEGQLGEPAEIAFSGGNLYVTDYEYDHVDEFSATSGAFIRRFGSEGTGSNQFQYPWGITCDSRSGNLYVADEHNYRVEEYNPAGTLLATFGSKGTGSGQFSLPDGIVVSSTGEVYVGDWTNDRIEEWASNYSTNNPAPTPPTVGANAISTVEYHVPLTGSSAPYQMTSAELAKWGQTKDEPERATALFPPDEPMGWPAADYKRATVVYMDEHARTTNTAAPSGAISTVEYNSVNEVTRTLTATARALALKEGSKSAEVAKALSSENIYNSEGTQLLETYGPEHKIKLSNGTEEETRDRQKFSYNEGKPSKGETYDLMTKAISWVEGAVNKELNKHEKTMSYSNSAQGELGWILRKPILVSEKVNGQTSTQSNTYNPETGQALEGSTSTTVAAPVFSFKFGAEGTGEGQFRKPTSEAFDNSGDLWVVDSGNNRVQVFSAEGALLKTLGSEGTGGSQFKSPWGIVISKSTGNAYVTDVTNDRVEEFSSTGTFVRTFGFGVSNGEEKFEICTSSCTAGKAGSGNGQFKNPQGIAVDSSGNVWVVDEGNSRVEEFKENGEYLSQFGSKGSENGKLREPAGIAISDGDVYVADYANDRVQEFSSSGSYINQFGTKGTGSSQFEGAEGIAADPVSGDLYVTDLGNGRVQEFGSDGAYMMSFGAKGSGSEQFDGPKGVAINQAGEIYVADTENNRVQVWEPIPHAPIYTSTFGSSGGGNGEFSHPMMDAVDSSGNVWVADGYNSRIEKFSNSGTYLATYGKPGSSETELQFNEPVGIAINQKTGNVYVGDQNNNRVVELSSNGKLERVFGKTGTGAGEFHEADGVAIDSKGDEWVTDYKNNRVQEFSENGAFIRTFGYGVNTGESKLEVCTSNCKAGIAGSGNGQLSDPDDIAIIGGDIYVTDLGNSRVDEFDEEGKTFVREWGSWGKGDGQFEYPSGITTGANGNVYVADSGNARVQEFGPTGAYLTQFGTKGSGNGQMEEPEGVALSSTGTLYVTDAGSNNRVQEWTPAPRPGNEGAKNNRIIYYGEAANAEYPACGNHPEWANLPCQIEPDAQPGDNGPPPLPVKATTYNMWDEPETITEKIGSVTRTKKEAYDSAGRLIGTEETSTSSEEAALPAVSEEYSSETGELVKESSTISGQTKTNTSSFNTLGQLAAYTDAEGATTKYTYDIDGRIEGIHEPMGSQSYGYNTTTGFMESLQDNGPEGKAGAGTFTASYGVSGELLTVNYPNGMKAAYTYNTIGQATNLEYEKTTNCTEEAKEKCKLFKDTEAFGPKRELVTQTSTFSKETYSYDEGGQLTLTKEESPSGGSCIEERAYGYNEGTDERLSLETRKPNEKGECAKEGGVVEEHDYDVADRLLDPGITYDALGDMTKIPALDAGGKAITSSFYVDNQVDTQEQNEKSIAYVYDPAGRTMIAKAKQGSSATRTISHYDGPGESVTWTCEEEEGKTECEEGKAAKWTRDIPGIDGEFDAIQTSGGTPVLQLHDLQGNVVATVEDSATATELLTKQNSTEYGVSPTGKTPKYGWLGASGAESELETGVITEAGGTYVPQLARALQTETPIPPGAAPNGLMDEEAYAPPELPWANQSGAEGAANTLAQQRTIEHEQAAAACSANPNECELEEEGDPYSTIYVSESVAWSIFAVVDAGTILSWSDFVKDITSALKKYFGVDFAAKLEEYAEKLIVGFNANEVITWANQVASGLEACIAEVYFGPYIPIEPGCSIGFATSNYHLKVPYPNPMTGEWESETIWEFQLPVFDKPPTIYYCPVGPLSCGP